MTHNVLSALETRLAKPELPVQRWLTNISQATSAAVAEARVMFGGGRPPSETPGLHKLRNKASKLDRLRSKSLSLPLHFKDRGEPEIPEAYAEGTPLTELFGNYPETKVIAALLPEEDRALPLHEIARLAGVSEVRADRHLEKLKRFDLVDTVEASGGVEKYRLNTEHETVVDLYAIEQRTLWDRLQGA